MSYKIKCKNEDFKVVEVPLLPHDMDSKPSTYGYIWLEKSGFTTFEAQEALKNFFKLKFEDINSQGLKDEQAITQQLVSIKTTIRHGHIASFNKKHRQENSYIKICHVLGHGKHPVIERMLHGNSFKITIRNLSGKIADKLFKFCTAQRHYSFINYYDSQRFGMPGGPYNTHLIGGAIVKNDWLLAYKYIKKTKDFREDFQNGKELSPKDFFKLLNPKKMSFFVSAYSSFLWNNKASALIFKKNKVKKYFILNVGDLHLPIENNFNCPHFCIAGGYEFIVKDFMAAKKENFRNLLVSTNLYVKDPEPDELRADKQKMVISFFLPTGSYATMLIKQIFLNLKSL